MKRNILKIIAVLGIIILILNLILFALKKINQIQFWTIIILFLIINYGIKKINKTE